MKLSTLLLSSAALVVAGSAFAADLPAKKGAPAAKATGCPAFGAGFFQIPGADTCIKFAGYVRSTNKVTTGSANTTHDMAASADLNVTVNSNSEIGVISSYADYSGSSLDYAYITFSGLTVGQAASQFDAGVNGAFYGLSQGPTKDQVTYSTALGSSTISLGLEETSSGGSVSSRPDVVLGLKTKAGAADLVVVASSHEARSGGTAAGAAHNAYSLFGKGSVAVGSATLAVFGSYAQGSSKTAIGSTWALTDANDDASGTLSTTQTAGGKITVAAGSGSVALYGAQGSTTTAAGVKSNVQDLALGYNQTIVKGLYMQPELVNRTTDGTTSQIIGLRIQRDF